MSQSGLVSIESSHPQIPTSFVTDAGTAIPLVNELEILGTNGITTTGAGKTVTVTGVTATAGLTAPAATIGVASFDSNDFTVTAGFVQIAGSFGGVQSILTDDGAPAVDPDVSGQVDIVSGGGGILVTGQGPGNTVTITGSSSIPTSFITDSGTAIPVGNVLNVLGGNNISTTGAVNNLTVDVTGTTEHAVQVGSASGSLTSLAAGTSGELLVGNTGADPAFGSTAYGDFSFSNILDAATHRSLAVVNTVADATSHADLRLSVAPAGGDAMVSWEVQGTLFYAMGVDNSDSDIWKLTTSSDPSGASTAIAVDNGTAAVKFADAYEFPVADGTANYVLKTDGAGNLDFAEAGTLLTDHDNILYVGKHGNDANDGKTPSNAKLTIQAAETAASVGDSIVVYPGTYTETITHSKNNITLIAMGKPSNTIITQADANVIDFNTRTGIQYKYFGISCTAATSAIWTVTGTTGLCSIKECQTSMTTAADVAAAGQAGVGRVTGAGTLSVVLGKVGYYHTGNGGATAQKAAFSVGNGGEIDLKLIEELIITNSGTALATAIGIDLASSGVFSMNDCYATITDPDATNVVGLAYVGGTGTDHEYYRNEIHVIATNNTGYGFFASDTASTSRFFYNHIHVTDVAGTSYSYHIGNGATVISQLDDVIAADGIQLVAGGTFTCASSLVDGEFTCRGREAAGIVQASVMNMDNTATSSNAALNLSVGGTTSTGDPYVNWLITGSTTWSAGIDNSDADAFKIGPNANPSTGNSDFEIATGGDITFNEAYTFPITDGTAGYVLATDGSGNVDWTLNSASGEVVQRVYTSTSALVSMSTDMPMDNTIPQKTEGDEVLTLSITPTNSSNILEINFISTVACNPQDTYAVLAIFQDDTTNAIAAKRAGGSTSSIASFSTEISHTMIAGTTSETTFKIRIGDAGTGGGTLYLNGGGGTRNFGGVASTTLSIIEYKA